MKASQFKKEYDKLKVWGDLDDLLEKVSKEDMKKLYEALLIVDAYTGLDMRQEFLVGVLKPLTTRGDSE